MIVFYNMNVVLVSYEKINFYWSKKFKFYSLLSKLSMEIERFEFFAVNNEWYNKTRVRVTSYKLKDLKHQLKFKLQVQIHESQVKIYDFKYTS